MALRIAAQGNSRGPAVRGSAMLVTAGPATLGQGEQR